MIKPIWDDLHSDDRVGGWVIPYSCPCCSKCWLRTNQKGEPLIIYDATGNPKLWCVHNGPYKGYVEIPDP